MTNRHLAHANPARHIQKSAILERPVSEPACRVILIWLRTSSEGNPPRGPTNTAREMRKTMGILYRGLRWIKTKFNWLKQQKQMHPINQNDAKIKRDSTNTRSISSTKMAIQPRDFINKHGDLSHEIRVMKSSTTDFTKKNSDVLSSKMVVIKRQQNWI